MQVQQQGVTQVTELVGRLKIGGRWYGPGSVVALDKADVEILEMRGIARKARPGAEPLNVEKKPQAEQKLDEPTLPETVKASHVPIQTKETPEDVKDTGHGNSHSQSRSRRR